MYPKYIQKYSVPVTQQVTDMSVNYFDIYIFNSFLLHCFLLLFVSANISVCLIRNRMQYLTDGRIVLEF